MTTKTVIVLPAYNAARTLERVVAEIPPEIGADLLVVDDASTDDTATLAQGLGVALIVHPQNRGYGGNQKTCYDAAMKSGADFVVMLHPDGQYDPKLIAPALAVLSSGVCDVVLGNRIRTRAEALSGGMPIAKYLANRLLTLIENILAGQNLGEWHSGFRAYHRRVLERVPYHANADGFVFDSQFLLQCVHFGLRLGDIPMPVRYFDGMSSISFSAAARYAGGTLWVFVRWILHRCRVWRCHLFVPRNNSPGPSGAV